MGMLYINIYCVCCLLCLFSSSLDEQTEILRNISNRLISIMKLHPYRNGDMNSCRPWIETYRFLLCDMKFRQTLTLIFKWRHGIVRCNLLHFQWPFLRSSLCREMRWYACFRRRTWGSRFSGDPSDTHDLGTVHESHGVHLDGTWRLGAFVWEKVSMERWMFYTERNWGRNTQGGTHFGTYKGLFQSDTKAGRKTG